MKILNKFNYQSSYEFRKDEILHIHFDEDEIEDTVKEYIVDYFGMSNTDKQWAHAVNELNFKYGIEKGSELIDSYLFSYENKSEVCTSCNRYLENIITRRTQLINGFKPTTKSSILGRDIIDVNGNQLRIGELYCIDCGLHKSDLLKIEENKNIQEIDNSKVEYILLDSRHILEKVKNQKALNDHEFTFLERTLISQLSE